MFKPNGKQQSDFRTERFYRYGIRKYSFGAASVAIATGLMFLGNGAVSANTTESSVTEATASTTSSESGSSSSEASSTVASEAPTVAARLEATEAATNALEVKEVEAPKAEVKATADKSGLQAKIAVLQSAIKSADKSTDSSALAFANKAVAEATAVLNNAEATQAEVDAQVTALTQATTVVNEASSQAKAAEADKKAAAAEAAQPAEKTELEKTVSEAVVTNRLANNFVEKEAKEKEVAVDLTDAVKAAVANNEANITASNQVLADKEATTDALKSATQQLQSSIEAVYVSLRKAGVEEFEVALADAEGAVGDGAIVNPNAQDYVVNPDGTTTATNNSAATSTGKDIYNFGSGLPGDVSLSNQSGDISTLVAVIGSNQRDGQETNAGNAQSTINGGTAGHNNTGRVDYPLTNEMAKKLAAEAPLWKGKLRADGSTISTANTAVYSAGGGYEYLATHIYHLAYEQGSDRVYIPNIKERFGVTAESAAAGWVVSAVVPSNLPGGLIYDAESDSIQGKIIANKLSNGVYDMRTSVTYTNTNTGATVTALYQNLRAGWIGWQDTTPPVIDADGQIFKGEVGGNTFTNSKGETTDGVDIKYGDTSGSRVMGGGANVPYTLADGRTATVRHNYNASTTGISGNVTTSTSGKVDTLIPGLQYGPNGSVNLGEEGYTGKGLIAGTPTEAGVYYVTAYAKDWNQQSGANAWTTDGHEARAGITITIAPKVEALNIATYSTEVPVSISNGATYATVTMPDGTVTAIENRNGKWVVVADGTTNTAVTAGDEVGTVGQQFNLKVNREATEKAGVDNITVYAKTENVLASLMRNVVTLKDADNSTHEATLNSATGLYELPADYATVRTEHSDGTYDVTQREVYTSVQADGSINYYIYAYNRTFDANGTVTAVNDVTRTETVYAKGNTENNTTGNGLYITVKYDKATDTWTASDGSTVTATKNSENKWTVRTTSGYTGEIQSSVAESTDKATIINTKPTPQSTSYESTLNTTVNLIDRPAADTAVVTDAKVSIKDTEDDDLAASDASDDFKAAHKTKVTSITVKDPDGNTVFADTTVGNADNYPNATELKLTKVGVYTVTINVLDSNTNYVNATLNGTDSGTDAGVNSSTATTTYTITVKQNIEGTPKTSSDIQGATQTGQPTFTFDDTDKSEINQGTKVYTLASTEAKDADGKTVGTYSIDSTTGVVTFVPNKDFTGTPTPAEVTLTVTFGTGDDAVTKSATATYTPTVVPVKPVAEPSETTDVQGATQVSNITYNADNNTDNNTNTLNFAKGSADVNGTTKSVELDKKTVQFVDGSGNAVDTLTVENQGTYSLVKDADENVTGVKFQPVATFTGDATPVTVQIKDVNGTVAKTTYTPHVTPVKATGTPATSTDIQGAEQSGTPTFTVSNETNIVKGEDGKPAATYALKGADADGKVEVKDGDKVLYTYTIDKATGEVTFTPAKDYKGQPTAATVVATYTLETEDKDDTTTTPITAEATYTPTIVPVTPAAVASETTGVQGQTQTSAIKFDAADEDKTTVNFAKGTTTVNDVEKSVDLATATVTLLDENGDEATTVTVAGQGTYTLDKDTNTISFTPEASFVGKADGVKVRVADANGTTATTTYTPTVTDVTMTSEDATSKDIQGQEQSGTPTFETSDSSVTIAKRELIDPTTNQPTTTVTIENEGTYTIDPTTGKVTFVPVPTFTGPGTGVTVQATDSNGETATAKYTPTVVPVTPTAVPSETTGVQGQTQTSAIKFDAADEDKTTVNFAKGTTTVNDVEKSVDLATATVTLLDENGAATNTVTVAGEGTYTLNGTTISFQPEASFVGKSKGVQVRVADANGTTATTTYTPTVTDVTLSSEDAASSAIQGATQTGTPTFTTSSDEVGIKSVKLVDPSTGNPTDATSVTVENEGTYTIDPSTGTVTFVPVPSFTGVAKGVTVQATDDNDETVTAKYTPTVTPVTLSHTDVTSKDIQGQEQNGTPTFTLSEGAEDTTKITGYKLVDPSTGSATDDTSVTVTGVGTYTIDPTTGKVTFSPNSDYTGTPAAIQVEATATVTNANNETATITEKASYTPTVVPATPTAKESATSGKQGKPQTSEIKVNSDDSDAKTVNFANGTADVDGVTKSVELNAATITLLDANGDQATSVTVAGKGTYTLNGTTITFQPTEDFVGEATPVQVRITDANGSSVTTTYTPTVIAEDGSVVVEYVDEDGNPLSDTETVVPNATVGTEYNTSAKPFTGYTLTETPSNANGKVTDGLTTVTYVYKKNDQVATITYKDVTDAANEVQLGDVDTVNGKFSDTIEYTTEARIKALEKAGYELVTDGFTTDEGRVYDVDNSANNYVVTLKQRTLPVVPTDVTPVPGEPVDPTDPDSPVWPNTDAVKNIETSKTVTRTIKYRYIDQNGQEASADVVQTVTFTRTANVNLVTGTVTYGDWSADETLAAVTSPSIANYSVDTASVASTTVTPDSEDSTVYVIYTPLAPTSTPATSTDIQGKEQTGTPSFKHADGTDLKPSTTNPAKFVGTTETTIPATKDGQPVGTYTIDPATGTVTFTPNKDFVGTPDPATVEVTDPTNGQTTTATYTPTVTPVTPTGVDTTSVGPKNTPQSGTPTFVPGNREVPMDDDTPATFEDGTTTKEVPNVGTFTVAKDGTVTFTPVNNYVGTPEGVVVVRKDINGTEAKAKYTPTVISEDGSVIAKFVDEDGKQLTDTTVVVENEETGTSYTTAPKTIPGYVLKETPANATGTVSNGLTTVTYVYEKATQNATITYVDVTTGTEKVLGDVDSTSGKFDEAINYSTEARIKALEKAGYELVTDGFTTEAGRVYDADDAKNNFKVSVKEKVVPTDVTPVPGQPVNPNDPDSPVWPDNDAVKNIETSKTVTRTIKYRYIDENGQEASADVVQTVTFTRTANVNLVTGTVTYGDWSADETLAAVTSPGIDGYTTATKSVAATTVTPNSEDSTVYVIYTATETPAKKVITSFVDEEGKELSPKEDGVKSSKTISGYELVKTEIDKDGNVTHVYKPVVKTTTSFVDGNGNPIPGTTTEDGEQPKKDIPGYEYVRTEKDPNGNTKHIYKVVTPTTKTTTSFVDGNGNPIPGTTTEDGEQPKKDIPGYEYVRTEKDPNGNTKHIYKVVTPATKTTTSFVDENGTPVSPNEDGNQPAKAIPGYELISSTTDKDGNVTHVYRKVATPSKTTTSFVDENGNPIRPNKDGNQGAEKIPGYVLVKTTVDANGNTIHTYAKLQPTTPAPAKKVAQRPVAKGAKQLPNTGTESSAGLAALGLAGLLGGLGLASRKKKED